MSLRAFEVIRKPLSNGSERSPVSFNSNARFKEQRLPASVEGPIVESPYIGRAPLGRRHNLCIESPHNLGCGAFGCGAFTKWLSVAFHLCMYRYTELTHSYNDRLSRFCTSDGIVLLPSYPATILLYECPLISYVHSSPDRI